MIGISGILIADAFSWDSLMIEVPLLIAGVALGYWLGRRHFSRIAARKARAEAERHQQDARKWRDALKAKAQEAQQLALDLKQTEDRLKLVDQARLKIFLAGRKVYLDRNGLRDEHQKLLDDSGKDREQLEAQTHKVKQIQRRMRAALKLEGQLWNAKALHGRPKFRPLERRQRAIVSVLNLKGGVGKTTVTAHLGRSLAVRGYRVLLVDMDLQGSLTTMMLNRDATKQAAERGGLLQDFLNNAVEDPTVKITDYVLKVFQHAEGGSLDIVGTSDSLAYAELNLTMRWLFGTGSRDTRFLLRKALHMMSVSDRYDIVLIDCPPLVNISCVNALAASDFVLIPTTMGLKSRERVPPTIKRIFRSEKFLKYVNHDIKLLGVIGNRTHRADAWTHLESLAWDELGRWCRDTLDAQDARLFETRIPDRREMREYEGSFTMPAATSRVAQAFASLTDEIEEALPRECRRTAKSPS